jgi:hypothetical protein
VWGRDERDGRAAVIEAVQHLAMDAEAQIRYLKELGTYADVDELVLQLDEILECPPYLKTFSTAARELLFALTESFDRMDDEALWSFEGLRTKQEWIAVRTLAKQILDLIDGVEPSE